jgi:hypothetical protein
MNWNEFFKYEDGNLYWLHPKIGRTLSKPVGTLNGHGYMLVKVANKVYPTHRVIWEMHNGDIPDGLYIDHIDRNRTNNRIENLRLATRQENSRNRLAKGFYWNKPAQLWLASIKSSDKSTHLGFYDNIIDARAAYLSARRALFGEFA